MNFFDWEQFRKLPQLLVSGSTEPARQAERIVAVQRAIGLPSKTGVMLVIYYFLFFSGWFFDAPTTQKVVQENLQDYFIIYVVCNLVGAIFLFCWQRIPPGFFQWLVFTMGLLDGLFFAAITVVTGGYDSILFWVFPGLIVLNALSIPLAVPQIILNVMLSLFYMAAILANPHIMKDQTAISFVPGRHLANHSINQVSRTG